jgi:hypothetical protein
MRISFIAIITVFVFSSCHYIMGERIYGNGHIATKDQNVGSFNSVDVGGAIEVHVKQDATQSVKIETDENLVQYIEVYTSGSTLVIHPRQGFNLDPSREIIVYVSAPAYKNIGVSGASRIIGDNALSGNDGLRLDASGASKVMMELNGGSVGGDVSGASSIDLKGQVSKVDFQASGASHINAYDLVADEAIADLSGASSMEITANKNLKAEASGASHVRYKGNASVNSNTSGASSVSKEG